MSNDHIRLKRSHLISADTINGKILVPKLQKNLSNPGFLNKVKDFSRGLIIHDKKDASLNGDNDTAEANRKNQNGMHSMIPIGNKSVGVGTRALIKDSKPLPQLSVALRSSSSSNCDTNALKNSSSVSHQSIHSSKALAKPETSAPTPHCSIFPLLELEKTYKTYMKSKKIKPRRLKFISKKASSHTRSPSNAPLNCRKDPSHPDEKSIMSLFNDKEDIYENFDTTIKRRHFAVKKLKLGYKNLSAKTKPIQYRLKKDTFYNLDGSFDYRNYYKALLLLTLHNNARHKIDYGFLKYEDFHIHKILAEVARIADQSTPYQLFFVWVFNIAKWSNIQTSALWFIVYFASVYFNKLATLVFLVPLYLIVYHRIRPSLAAEKFSFEDPSKAYIKSTIIKKAAHSALGKTVAASYIYELLYSNTRAELRVALSDMANLLEMAKNCVTWKNRFATRLTAFFFATLATIFFTLPPLLVYQIFLYLAGIQFFVLFPLQYRFAQYRRLLFVPEYFLWASSTDLELAADIYNTELAKNDVYFSVYRQLDHPALCKTIGVSEHQLCALEGGPVNNNKCDNNGKSGETSNTNHRNANTNAKQVPKKLSKAVSIRPVITHEKQSKRQKIKRISVGFRKKIRSMIGSSNADRTDYTKFAHSRRRSELITRNSISSAEPNIQNRDLNQVQSRNESQGHDQHESQNKDRNSDKSGERNKAQGMFTQSNNSLDHDRSCSDNNYYTTQSGSLASQPTHLYCENSVSDQEDTPKTGSICGSVDTAELESWYQPDVDVLDLSHLMSMIDNDQPQPIDASYRPWPRRTNSFDSFDSLEFNHNFSTFRRNAFLTTRLSNSSDNSSNFDFPLAFASGYFHKRGASETNLTNSSSSSSVAKYIESYKKHVNRTTKSAKSIARNAKSSLLKSKARLSAKILPVKE